MAINLPARDSFVRYTPTEVGMPVLIGRVAGYTVIDADPTEHVDGRLTEVLVVVELAKAHQFDAFDRRLHISHLPIHPEFLDSIDASGWIGLTGEPDRVAPAPGTLWDVGPLVPDGHGVQAGDVVKVTSVEGSMQDVWCEYEDGSGELEFGLAFFGEHFRRADAGGAG